MREVLDNIRFQIDLHKYAILLAILSGLILIAPSLMAPRELGERYQGVPFLYQDNEVYYASRVKEVIDGYLSLNSPMLYEYKDDPAPLSPFGEYIYGLISLIFGMDIVGVIVFSKFLFPFILFLLIYLFAFNLLKETSSYSRLAAISVASVSIMGFDLISSSALNYLQNAGTDHTYLSIWTRLVNPITGGLYLFSFLILLQYSLRYKKFLWLPTGIVLGLMTGYFFSFTLAFFLVLFWTLVFIIKREYAEVYKLIKILIVGGLVNLHTFNYFLFLRTEDSNNVSPFRSGLLETNSFLLNKILLISTLIFAVTFYFFRNRITENGTSLNSLKLWLSGLIVSSLVSMNIQVILGYAIWPQHFVQYTNIFSVLVLVSSIALICEHKFKIMSKLILIILIVLPFAFAIKTVDSYKFSLNSYTNEQRYAEALNWINKNGGNDCSVLVNEKRDKLAPFIAILTACNSYHTSYVSVGLPYMRVMHNYFVLLRMEGINEENIEQYLNENKSEIYHEYFFRDWKDMFFESRDPWLISISNRSEIEGWINDMVKSIALSYKEFIKKDFYDEVTKYNIDFVLWDENSGLISPKEKMPFIEEVYSSSGIHIYKILKK